MGRGEGCTGFWWGNLRERDHWGPRRRWEVNIKINLQEVGGGSGDWMQLAQDRDRWRALVSRVMNFRVPKMRGISLLDSEPVSFLRRTLLYGVISNYILLCSNVSLIYLIHHSVWLSMQHLLLFKTKVLS